MNQDFSEQQASAPTDTARAPLLRWAWMLSLAAALICLGIYVLLSGSAIEVDADGFVRQPSFGFVSMSVICLIVAVCLAVLDTVRTVKRRMGAERE